MNSNKVTTGGRIDFSIDVATTNYICGSTILFCLKSKENALGQRLLHVNIIILPNLFTI